MPKAKSTKCWYCGSKDTKPDERGTICNACGATDNPVPKISHAIPSDEGAVVSRRKIRQGKKNHHILI